MPAPKIAAFALSFLLAGSLVACGGDDGGSGGEDAEGGGETVSAAEFAGNVCGAMKTWVTTVQEKSQEMSTGATGDSAEESKEVLVTLLGEMGDATGDLVSSVEEAGVPDVEGGEAVADDLVSAFTQAQEILEEAQADVEALPSDPAGFQQGAAELGPTLQEAIASITDSLEEPESEELEKAFDEEPACDSAAA